MPDTDDVDDTDVWEEDAPEVKDTDLPATPLVEDDKRKWDGGGPEGDAWIKAMKANKPSTQGTEE